MTEFIFWGRRHANTLRAETFALDVAEDNLEARSFFATMGFTEDHEARREQHELYSHGQDALRMTLLI